MISKKVKVYERQDFQKEKLESVWCNIYSKSGNSVLGSVYIPPNDSKSMKVLMKVIDRLRLESLPIIIVGDFNAHHPYWFDKSANKLGNELFEYLVDKDLVLMNNSEPTRKDNIIDLTIVSTVLSSKIEKWKVQHEVYLNSDHRLISFEFGEETSIEVLERFDFKNTDWDKYEKEWLEGRRYDGKIDDELFASVA